MEIEYYVIQAFMPNVEEDADLGFLSERREFDMDRIVFAFDFRKAMRFDTEKAAREYFEKFGTRLDYEVFKVTIEKMED